jgi:hypothetical protein
MDFKIYKLWTEEFKGYYWEVEGNAICEYTWDTNYDDVEDLLDVSTLRKLEQHNKNTKFGYYPARIVAERFKPVDLTEEDFTALKQEVLDDDNDDLLQELNENYNIENYDDLYMVAGELYYFDENTENLYYCESEGMISPVGYDPNDDDEDNE